jgi:acetolactate synthase-1/2/3 large subunit
MVALGERMTDSVSQSYSFPSAPQPQLPFVHVWPDPNEVGRVWRPDLGIPCNAHEVVKALLQRGAPPDAGKRRGWVDGLNAIHRKLLAKEWGRPRMASISPPSYARSTSTLHQTRR